VVSDELHALNNSRKCAVTFEQYQITVTSSNVDCSCFHFKGLSVYMISSYFVNFS